MIDPDIEIQCRWYMAAADWDVWNLPRIYRVRRRDVKAEKKILSTAEDRRERYGQLPRRRPHDRS